MPKEARWSHLKASAPQPTVGKIVDDAMAAIERDNPSLKGVLPKDYARPGLDKQRLGQLINLVSDIGLGSSADRANFKGVFAPLGDPAYFARVRVNPELGTITWPNGADWDPLVLYSLVTGRTIESLLAAPGSVSA